MARYVYDRKREMMVNKATGEPMLTEEERSAPIRTPATFGDIPGYESPITGEWIEGRKARAYDLQKHGCVDARELAPEGGRRLKNEDFIRRRKVRTEGY